MPNFREIRILLGRTGLLEEARQSVLHEASPAQS